MNPWIIVGFLGTLIAVGAGGYVKGHSDGVTKEHAAALARDNDELVAANASIRRLEEAARATEQAHATALAKIGEDHQKEISDAAAQKDRDIAAARAGRIILRIPAPCKGANGSAATKAPASTGVGDGGTTAELPRTITEDLLVLADDADSVVRQLAACQAVIRSDRSNAL